jgi:hypothetical protein
MLANHRSLLLGEDFMRVSNIRLAHPDQDQDRAAADLSGNFASPGLRAVDRDRNASPMFEDQAGNALTAAFLIAFHDREQRLAIDARSARCWLTIF